MIIFDAQNRNHAWTKGEFPGTKYRLSANGWINTDLKKKKKLKKCASGRGIAAKCCSLTPPKKAQLRAPLSSLQTAWTGFDPNLYSSGSSSAGPALVENSNCKVFYTQQGHCE